MNITIVSKKLSQKVIGVGKKTKKVMGVRKSQKKHHNQNNIYGQYLIQESKDIDRTIKSLERILIQ